MPNIVIQNLTTEDVYLGDFYTKVPKPVNNGPCFPIELGTVESFKTSVELMQSVSLQKAIADGKVSLGITFTQDEIDSGFDIWPGLTAGAANIDIQDEGVSLTTTPTLINFVGSGVLATVLGNAVTVTVSGTAGSADERYGVLLAGALDGVNRTFTTPENFTHVVGGRTIRVYHNGRRLYQTDTPSPVFGDYYVSESGGIGTGYDTVNFLRFIPNVRSNITADYIVP